MGELLDRAWAPAPGQPAPEPREGADNAAPDPIPDIRNAADWIRTLLAASASDSGLLPVLCLDPEGAVCSWITTTGGSPGLIAAVARSGPTLTAESPEGEAAASTPTPLAYFAPSPLDSSIESLSAPRRREPSPAEKGKPAPRAAVHVGERTAVLGVSDAAVRVLIDELDQRGVECRAVVTLWHAMAAAWDASTAAVAGSQAADAAPASACVLIDPEGRLIWSWSRSGRLLAGGMFRVPLAPLSEEPDAETAPWPGPADAARLTAEWLAWSVQLGVAPTRIVGVLPSASGEAGAAQDFGAALARGWSNATLDLTTHHDPILATLTRFRTPSARDALAAPPAALALAAQPSEPGAARLRELTCRPATAHRRLFYAASIAILGAAAGLAGLAWNFSRSASHNERLADGLLAGARDDARAVYPTTDAVRTNAELIEDLRALVGEERANLEPAASLEPNMPVLEEFATLALVVGNDRVELDEIVIDQTNARVIVAAADIARVEEIQNALGAISGSGIELWRQTLRQMPTAEGPTRIRAEFIGAWSPEAGRSRAPESTRGNP